MNRIGKVLGRKKLDEESDQVGRLTDLSVDAHASARTWKRSIPEARTTTSWI
jgi:hypothetical protein